MKKTLTYLLGCLLILSMINCSKKEINPYLISKSGIGNLTDSTQVRHLNELFPNDSISRFIGGDEFTGAINDIEIYDTTGKLLLVLTPREALDSTSTFKSVRIVDSRYITESGLNVDSRFKDIVANYKISSVQNTLRSLVVSVDDMNAYFTIDKLELPANMRYDMTLKIDPIQIPDNARIRDFFIQWY